MRIVVLSTFDIWPPRDGGQTRYVNLWRNFPPGHDVVVIAYEFRNTEGLRRYKLADHLEVVVPRASHGDANHFAGMMDRTSLWLHDVLCLRDYLFSREFLETLRENIASCDVLIASHPYLARVAFPMAGRDVIRIYESYNVEYDIKAKYFANGKDPLLLAGLLREVESGEAWASRYAHRVTAVSENDRSRLVELYDLPPGKVSVVPNGTHVRDTDLLTREGKAEVRERLGLGSGPVGLFLGSSYEANVASYRRARDMLEDVGFRGTILLIGSIDSAPRGDWPAVGFTEVWLGFVDEELRDLLLGAADFALHLIFAGAGTNLKLFDYMGAGLPVVANEFGRRGIEEDDWWWPADSETELRTSIESIMSNRKEVARRSAVARDLAKATFDWRRIAQRMAEVVAGEPAERPPA